MREQQSPEPVRENDLSGVQMPCQDEVPTTLGHAVEHVREVAEQNADRRRGPREAARTPGEPRARVDAGQLELLSAQLDDDRLVEPEDTVPAGLELDRLR